MARDQAQLLEMGERIRQLREAHGYKQQWIADQVGVTLRSYQFWQAGKSPPEQENLEKLAKLFGVKPKYILQGDTPDLASNGQDSTLTEILELLRRLDARLTDAEQERSNATAQQLERAAVILQRLDHIEAAIQEIAPRRRRTA